MKKKRNLKNIIILLTGMLIVGTITYWAALAQTIKVNSDYYFHANWSRTISIHHLETFFSTYKVLYPVWHFLVFFFYRIGAGIETASAIVAALTNMLLFFISITYMRQNADRKICQVVIGAVVLLLLQPLWIGMGYAVTMGHFSPNEWRNPTTLIARPFGMVAFIFLVRILKRPVTGQKINYFIYMLASSLSVLAKPSFLQMFIPGIGFYMAVELIQAKQKKVLFIDYVKIAAASIPSVAILFLQFFSNFGEGNQIGISWLEFWRTHTNNILLSMIMAFAFPIYYCIIDWRRLFSLVEVRLVTAIQVIAWLEGAVLVETGSRRSHGNFVWANSLAMFLLFAVMIKEFLCYSDQSVNTPKRAKVLIGWGILLLHFISGIHWVAKYIIGI